MPILNYSTEVPPERTVSEITSLLVRKGARSVTSNFSDKGEITGVTFVMHVGGLPTLFQLPANIAGVTRALLREKPWKTQRGKSKAMYEAKVAARARWVAWRILKDWVSAQMALIESEQAEAAQLFMPYAKQEDGRTMFELFVANNQKLLAAGECTTASA